MRKKLNTNKINTYKQEDAQCNVIYNTPLELLRLHHL